MQPGRHIKSTPATARQESTNHQIIKSTNEMNLSERELKKLEMSIRSKMADIRERRVTLKDSGIGGLLNSLRKVDEASYEKIFHEYKLLVSNGNILK